MSKKGIELFASVLTMAQQVRGELLEMGSRAKPINKQDIILGQLLDVMKDSVKERFYKAINEGE